MTVDQTLAALKKRFGEDLVCESQGKKCEVDYQTGLFGKTSVYKSIKLHDGVYELYVGFNEQPPPRTSEVVTYVVLTLLGSAASDADYSQFTKQALQKYGRFDAPAGPVQGYWCLHPTLSILSNYKQRVCNQFDQPTMTLGYTSTGEHSNYEISVTDLDSANSARRYLEEKAKTDSKPHKAAPL
jgi:hypothetical protein